MKCANDRCGREFYPRSDNHKFCNYRCRKSVNDRDARRRASNDSLERQLAPAANRTIEESIFLAQKAEALLAERESGATTTPIETLDNVISDIFKKGSAK